jgi:beta-glucuronidase
VVAGSPFTFSRNKAAGDDVEFDWSGILNNACLWYIRDLFPHDAMHLDILDDEITASRGACEIRVQRTQLLLNGKPVHLFGANPVSEDPLQGLQEPDAICGNIAQKGNCNAG